MGQAAIDTETIRRAGALLRQQLDPTPLIHSEYFSQQTGAEVFLKLENLQRTGSFKIRGALNRLHTIPAGIAPKGVIAASAGNHAQGVALAAHRLGVAATIVMPESTPIGKQLATSDYGGKVILHGHNVEEALQRALGMECEGYTFVHPFDDPYVISGQASIGLELLEQLSTFDEVWIPVGGGGLAAGIALAIHQQCPQVRIVGVQTEACASAAKAIQEGKPVAVVPQPSIADGILVPRIGDLPLQILSQHLHEVLTVAESAIASAMVQLLEKRKLVAEGAGAVALAALLSAGSARLQGKRVVVVISGGNIDLNILDRVLEMGLIRTGRILRFAVSLDDHPGALARLLEIIAVRRANILHVVHDRLAPDLPVGATRVCLTLETRGLEHNRELIHALGQAGYAAEFDPHLTAPG